MPTPRCACDSLPSYHPYGGRPHGAPWRGCAALSTPTASTSYLGTRYDLRIRIALSSHYTHYGYQDSPPGEGEA
jgi:hypothetical protein